MLRGTATLAGVPSSALLIVFMVLGEVILRKIYGSYYGEGYLILIILSIGSLSQVLGGSNGLTLMMTGFENLLMMISIGCGVITVAMAILLVGNYGATGVAVATTTGLVLQNIGMVLGARYGTGMWTHVSIAKGYRYMKGVKDILRTNSGGDS